VSADDWPIFGRDVPDVAWRPTPQNLTDSRLARFLKSTGESGLTALQHHAERDPAWFWGAAADDLTLAWQRRPRDVMDISRGMEAESRGEPARNVDEAGIRGFWRHWDDLVGGTNA
jgi:hypothetical protein